jgi:hypothetical protein
MTQKATTITFREMKEKLHAHAIGYAGLSQLAKLEAKDLTIDGIAATAAHVADGRYPLVRRMSLYQREPTLPLADDVTAYFRSPAKGHKLIVAAGNVPVAP